MGTMKLFYVFLCLLYSASVAFSATIVTTNARDTQPGHFHQEITLKGRSGGGAYLSIWSNDNWKTAMIWFRPKDIFNFRNFYVDCPGQCVNYGRVLIDNPLYSGPKPWELVGDTRRPFRYALIDWKGNKVDAWNAMSGFGIKAGFFGNELFHTASISLDDRSQKRYDFALWDVRDKRGYLRSPATEDVNRALVARLPTPAHVPAPIPLVLLSSSLCLLLLNRARRPR